MAYALSDFKDNQAALEEIAKVVFDPIAQQASPEVAAAFSQVAFNVMSFGAPWELYTAEQFRNLNKGLAKSIIRYMGAPESVYEVACKRGFVLHMKPQDIAAACSFVQNAPEVKLGYFQFNPATGKAEKVKDVSVPMFSQTFLQAVYSRTSASYAKLQNDFAKVCNNDPKSDLLKGNRRVALLSLNNDSWVSLPNEGKIPAYSVSLEQFSQATGIQPTQLGIGPKSRSFIVQI